MRWPRPHCHSGTIMAILNQDLCIAGVFGAGKTRSLAVLLIALSCELDDFSAVVFTRRMLRQKPLLTRSVTSLPTLAQIGRLLGRDVVIETESSRPNASLLRLGSATAEMSSDTPPSANGCPGFGLHLWMKVSNMATIMKLLHLRPFSSLLLLCL